MLDENIKGTRGHCWKLRKTLCAGNFFRTGWTTDGTCWIHWMAMRHRFTNLRVNSQYSFRVCANTANTTGWQYRMVYGLGPLSPTPYWGWSH